MGKYRKQVVVSMGSVSTRASVRENKDRVAVHEIIGHRERGSFVTPDAIAEIRDKIDDDRLVAYILGVTEHSVRQVREGVLFPDDLMFKSAYLCEKIGTNESAIYDEKKRLFGHKTTSKKLNSDQAKQIASNLQRARGGSLVGSSSISIGLGVSLSVVYKFIRSMGIEVDLKESFRFMFCVEKTVADVIISKLMGANRIDILRTAQEIHHDPQRSLNALGSIRMKVKDGNKSSVFQILPSSYSDIMQGCYDESDNWSEYITKVGNEIRKESANMVSEIRMVANKKIQ